MVKEGKRILGGRKGWFGCLGAAARTAAVSHLALLGNSVPVAQKCLCSAVFIFLGLHFLKSQARKTVRGYRSERLKGAEVQF